MLWEPRPDPHFWLLHPFPFVLMLSSNHHRPLRKLASPQWVYPPPLQDWGCETPVPHLAWVSFTLQSSPGIRLELFTAEMRSLSYLAASGKWCWPLANVIWESSFLLDPQLPPNTGKPLPKLLCVCGVKDLSYVKHIVGPQFSYRCLLRDPVSFVVIQENFKEHPVPL